MTEKRRERERVLRRELLLEAAERVFGRKPFDEATMQEVAAEAQIGMQGLYEHFPSKQSLYEGLILQRVQEFHEGAARALQTLRDPMKRLRAWSLLNAETFRKDPAFFPVFLREKIHHDWDFSSRFGPAIYELFDREEKRVRGLLDAAAKTGALRKLDPDFLVQLYLGALYASLQYHFRQMPEEEVETCVDRALNCFLGGAGVQR
jgi:AcrR family transcriptional regulator